MTAKKLFFLTFLLLAAACTNRKEKQPSSNLELLSFYKGYQLWNEKLRDIDKPYDFEQIINGIRAAEKKDLRSIDEAEIEIAMGKLQEELITRKSNENLVSAELFLRKSKEDLGTKEIIPSKLYYKKLKDGYGKPICYSDTPLISYSAKLLDADQEIEIHSRNDEPISINLSDTIPGFAEGVMGMLVGEERILYIHPELAYGGLEGRLGLNNIVIIDVEIVGLPQVDLIDSLPEADCRGD